MKPRYLFLLLRTSFLVSIFGLFFNGTSANIKAPSWLSCYDSSTNQIHFQNNLRKRKQGDKCLGKTKFRMKPGWQLVENEPSDNNFGRVRAGTKKTVALSDGRRILTAQWERPDKSNLITVLEPELNRHRVKRHCVFVNAADAFSTRYNPKTKQLLVLVTNKNKSQRQWRACQL